MSTGDPTSSSSSASTVALPLRPRDRLTEWLGNIRLWVILSLVFIALMRLANPDSKEATIVWFLDPMMSVVFLWLMRLDRMHRLRKLKLPPALAAIAFVTISWMLGMLTELTISTGAGGYGGLHDKTIPSFILAQGYYLPLAIMGWYFVRRYHLTFYELFFAAGMTSLYEAAVFGVPMMISPTFFLIPVVIAYYFVIYSRLLSMVLLILDPESLWDAANRTISFRRKLFYGFVMGLICWAFYVIWGITMHQLLDEFNSF